MKLMPENFTIHDYLHHSFECSCGRKHHTAVERIIIAQGARRQVPELIKEMGYEHIFMVSDSNTYEAAGKELEEILREADVRYTSYVIPRSSVVPDEYTMGELLIHFDRDCDLIVGVGTGTINDMCKFMSSQMGLEYFIFATAPSMDGFASVGAPLISGNLKITYDAHVPQAIIGDVDILARAPMNMIAAGVADVLGKYTCLCDWHMAHIINGEYFCPVIERMVRLALAKMMDQAKDIKKRDPETIKTIMEALVLTGIAMSFVGNSRPASGCEHHMSHYWEMLFLFQGRPAVLHGTKVGVGTAVAVRLYKELAGRQLDFEWARKKAEEYDVHTWEENMRRTYGIAAEGVIEHEKTEKKNDPSQVKERLITIEKQAEVIKRTIEELVPSLEMVQEVLKELDAPVNPLELGIDRDMVSDSIMVAKEVRNRYTLLQLLWDLGLLEEMAQKTADYFETTYRG